MVGRGRFRLGRFVKKQLGGQGARYAGTLTKSAVSRYMGGSGLYTARGSPGLSGRGAYGVDGHGAPLANTSESMVMGQRFHPPHFNTAAVGHDDGGLLISNQEFVQNVYGNPSGVGFVSNTYNINPGLAEVFPLLSQFAGNFDRYEMVQLAFHFETQLDSGIINSASGQVGTILMHSHTDINTPDYQNVSDFEQNGASTSRITHGLATGVECDPEMLAGLPNAGLNYIRTGPRDDISESDLAKFQIAVSNTPVELADQVIGKLYVSYTVKLVKPKIMSMVSRNVLVDEFIGYSGQALNDGNYPPLMSSSFSALSINRIGAVVTTTASTPTAGMKLNIKLPSWLKGLINVRVISHGGADDEPVGDAVLSDMTDYTGRWFGAPVITGEVQEVRFTPSMSSSGTMQSWQASSGSDNLENSVGLNKQRDSPSTDVFGFVCVYSRHFRVSPALTTDNTITLPQAGGAAQTYNWAYRKTHIVIEVVNDYNAVGTQGIGDVASI